MSWKRTLTRPALPLLLRAFGAFMLQARLYRMKAYPGKWDKECPSQHYKLPLPVIRLSAPQRTMLDVSSTLCSALTLLWLEKNSLEHQNGHVKNFLPNFIHTFRSPMNGSVHLNKTSPVHLRCITLHLFWILRILFYCFYKGAVRDVGLMALRTLCGPVILVYPPQAVSTCSNANPMFI